MKKFALVTASVLITGCTTTPFMGQLSPLGEIESVELSAMTDHEKTYLANRKYDFSSSREGKLSIIKSITESPLKNINSNSEYFRDVFEMFDYQPMNGGAIYTNPVSCPVYLTFDGDGNLDGLRFNKFYNYSTKDCQNFVREIRKITATGTTSLEDERKQKQEDKQRALINYRTNYKNCISRLPKKYSGISFEDQLDLVDLLASNETPRNNYAYRASDVIEVMQSVPGGILVRVYSLNSQIAFIKTSKEYVDGQLISPFWVIYNGKTYSYQTIFGAQKKVYRFDALPDEVSDIGECVNACIRKLMEYLPNT